jgi:hypothetical protein
LDSLFALEVGCTRREREAGEDKWEKYRRSVIPVKEADDEPSGEPDP